jgi:CubicO group peptidase (beta-lactamase class C family)
VRLQRALLVLVILLLTLVALSIGVLAADWPFWRRVVALAQLPDAGEWPESFYQPVARIGTHAEPQPFAPVAAPEAQTIAPEALAAAARWAGEHHSVALLVLHRGRLQLEQYWDGMTPDTLFSGRAMSRSLLGFAVGFAVRDGRVALDEPVEKYLEEWRDEPRGRITLRQLLQNVSGLEEVPLAAPPLPPGAGWPQRVLGRAGALLNKNARLSLGKDFAGAALSFGLEHEPGTRFAFSNANSQLAGVVLERATGVPFESWVEQKLWGPSGAGIGEFYLDRRNGMPAVYCCFRASPHDFLRLGVLLAHDGAMDGRQVLPAGWVAEMARGSRVNPNYGLQVWTGNVPAGVREYFTGSRQGITHGEPYTADDVIWMEGGGGRTVWAIPSRDLVIVRLGRAAPGWDAAVLPNLLLRGVRSRE